MRSVRSCETGTRSALHADAIVAFANRLSKNARHWSRWARRHGFGAYRIYDRDLPEFPLAIDCYLAEEPALGLRVHLQEIDTGWEQSDAEHDAWLAAAGAAAAEVLHLPPDAIVAKVRRKRRARVQHEPTGVRGREFAIIESGLRFFVNLDAYLDTGLFLDHRALRAIVRERAQGRRMLNLFAYTGSFTVYAAAGGAICMTDVPAVSRKQSYGMAAKRRPPRIASRPSRLPRRKR